MIKSSKKITNLLEFKNFFIIDNEMLCEFSSTLFSKMLLKTDFQALIIIEKQNIDKFFKSFIINLIEIKASTMISMNKKLFYTTEIKTKLRLIYSWNVKEFIFINQHLILLKFSHSVLWQHNQYNISQVEKFNSNSDFDNYIFMQSHKFENISQCESCILNNSSFSDCVSDTLLNQSSL